MRVRYCDCLGSALQLAGSGYRADNVGGVLRSLHAAPGRHLRIGARQWHEYHKPRVAKTKGVLMTCGAAGLGSLQRVCGAILFNCIVLNLQHAWRRLIQGRERRWF